MIRSLTRVFRPKTNATRPTTRRRAQLAVEALEDRQLMSAGWLDPGFGTTLGRTQVDFNFNGYKNGQGQAMALQPDGKVVVAGYATYSSTGDTDFAVTRLNANGLIDYDFGYLGRKTIAFDLGGGNNDWATAVAIDDQGRIVVAGTVERGGGNYDFGICRLNPDGSIDTTFGINGRSVAAFDLGGAKADFANAMVIDPQGRILVAGSAEWNGSDTDFAVCRLTPDGYFDPSFGWGGKQTVAFDMGGGNGDAANGIALDSQGRIVLAGYAHFWDPNVYTLMAVTRLTSDGWLDTSFGGSGDGKATIYFAPQFGNGYPTVQLANAVAVDAQDRIVVAGVTWGQGLNGAFAVARLGTDGLYDNSFGVWGRQIVQFDLGGNNFDEAKAVALDAQGRIVVAGTSSSGPYVNKEFSVCRLTDSGWFDPSFGNGGRQWFFFNSAIANWGNALAIDPQGRVLMAGTLSLANGSSAIGVARLTGDDDPPYGPAAGPSAALGLPNDFGAAPRDDGRPGAGGPQWFDFAAAGTDHDRAIALALAAPGRPDTAGSLEPGAVDSLFTLASLKDD
jgi:uncharacterized delta-60 repeat protein